MLHTAMNALVHLTTTAQTANVRIIFWFKVVLRRKKLMFYIIFACFMNVAYEVMKNAISDFLNISSKIIYLIKISCLISSIKPRW